MEIMFKELDNKQIEYILKGNYEIENYNNRKKIH